MISTEEGEQFAKKHDLIFIEASAKTGTNVDKVKSQYKIDRFSMNRLIWY